MESKVEVTTISSFCETVSAELGIDFQNIIIEGVPNLSQVENYGKQQFTICTGT